MIVTKFEVVIIIWFILCQYTDIALLDNRIWFKSGHIFVNVRHKLIFDCWV